ncbi:class I SAM-dependent methyltransferase [Leptolyngbya sp. FACHB-671]|uniref:class I SAM-dependent methyltransferase n=1 Tax=Leptolyngbya sp. FACHB-671 TaxID=2692812 RepID=UPI001A7E4F92|nr:class I SAM-dependent methyltransferase [Leptolyngbya sp. FACHB-671]
MKPDVFKQYQAESENWLKRGRRSLLRTLLEEAGRTTGTTKPLDILEVGAGVGQNIPTLQEFGQVEVVEVSDIGLAALKDIPNINRIYSTPIPFNLSKSYDIICALDVVEHIEDDKTAVKWLVDRLKPGGYLITTVPAYQWLFSDHDIALGHYRRYTQRTFNRILPAELTVLKSGYFNSVLFLLAAAIRLVKRLTKSILPSRKGFTELKKESSTVPGWVDSAFGNFLLVETKIIEGKPIFPFGLSVFCLAQKVSN